MKRLSIWTGLAAVLTAAAVILAGCGSGSGGSGGSGEEGSGKQVTLRFSWWGSDDRHQATLAAIKLYEEKNPNVKIEAEYGGFDGYDQKIKTQLAGGTAPDVIQLDAPWLAELNKNGNLLLDLGKEQAIDLSGFDETFLKDFVTVGEETVALPMGVNGRVLLMNKTLADQFGLALDKQLTWDSLLEMARTVREKEPNAYLLNADAGIVQMAFLSILRQRTKEPLIKDDNTLSFTNDQAREAFDWVNRAYEAGVFQPYGESQLFTGKLEQNPKWINQQFVGIEAWSSELTKYESALPQGTTTVPLLPPKFEDALTGSALVRPSMVISVNKKTEHKDEAVKFVNWLLNDKEAAVALGDSRAVPAVESSRTAIVEADKVNPNVSKGIEQAQKDQAKPDNAVSQNSQISEVVEDVLQKVAFKSITPEQAAEELKQRLTDKVAEITS